MTQRTTNTNSERSTGASRSGSSMDPEVPVRYLRENFQPGDRIAVVLIQKQTHRVIQRVATVDKIGESEFQGWLRHANANRFEVYVGMNTLNPNARSRTKEDVAAVRHIYLDFDHNGTTAVQSMIQRTDLPEPNYLINSSPGKWQVVWKVEGFQQDEAERLMRQLVRELGQRIRPSTSHVLSKTPRAAAASRVPRRTGGWREEFPNPNAIGHTPNEHSPAEYHQKRSARRSLPSALDKRTT
jgi:hypothetical protein